MKKLSLILSAALLLGGISFASPVVKQAAQAPATKQAAKSAAKGTKSTKTPVKKAPTKKVASAAPAAK